jgi:hypothetical protein
VKAGWQGVPQEGPDERHRLEGDGLALSRTEADAPAVEGHEALVEDGDAVGVPAEVALIRSCT